MYGVHEYPRTTSENNSVHSMNSEKILSYLKDIHSMSSQSVLPRLKGTHNSISSQNHHKSKVPVRILGYRFRSTAVISSKVISEPSQIDSQQKIEHTPKIPNKPEKTITNVQYIADAQYFFSKGDSNRANECLNGIRKNQTNGSDTGVVQGSFSLGNLRSMHRNLKK